MIQQSLQCMDRCRSLMQVKVEGDQDQRHRTHSCFSRQLAVLPARGRCAVAMQLVGKEGTRSAAKPKVPRNAQVTYSLTPYCIQVLFCTYLAVPGFLPYNTTTHANIHLTDLTSDQFRARPATGTTHPPCVSPRAHQSSLAQSPSSPIQLLHSDPRTHDTAPKSRIQQVQNRQQRR